MSTIVQRQRELDFLKIWDRLCAWITSTENRANLGLQAMHAPNTHHFPMIIAASLPIPVN